MKRLAMFIAFTVIALIPGTADAVQVYGTNCSINYYGSYNSWYGWYQASVTSWDSDCQWVQARVHNTTSTDYNYSFAATAHRSSLGSGYFAGVKDTSGRQGGFWY